MSQLLPSGGQSIGASASALGLPMNIQGWFPLGWSGWISLLSKGLSRVPSSTTKSSVLQCLAFCMHQLSHHYMTTGKTIVLTIHTFIDEVMSLLFNMLSRFTIVVLPRSKFPLISWVQSLSSMIWEPKERKFATVSNFSSIYLKWWDQMPRF